MKLLILVMSLLLLSGCMTTAEYFKSEAARQEANFGPACESLGFKKGTEGYGNCILKMQENEIRRGG